MGFISDLLKYKGLAVNKASVAAVGSAMTTRGNGWTIVSNRSCRTAQNDSGVTSATTRFTQMLPCDVYALRTGFSNTWTNGTGENPYPCAVYIESVVQDHGTLMSEQLGDSEWPLTIGGRKGKWFRSGEVAMFDPLIIGKKRSEYVHYKTFAKVSTKAVPLWTSTNASTPTIPKTTANANGGTLRAGSYTISCTYVFADGEETQGSATVTVATTGTTGSITITSPDAVNGAIGWRCYVGFKDVTAPQYQAAVDIIDIGTNYTFAIEAQANQSSTACVIGGTAFGIPGGSSISGDTIALYSSQVGDGKLSGVYAMNNGRRVPANSSTIGVMPYFVLGLTTNSYPSVAIWGDSISQAVADFGYMPNSSAGGAGMGGGFMRLLHNQMTNRIFDVTVVPTYGFVWPATGGERGDQFAAPTGNKRKMVSGYATTVFNNYGTNDFGASQTAAQVISSEITNANWVVKLGKRYIRTTLLPRTNSTDGWQTAANQSYVIYNGCIQLEGYRRQFNNWLLDVTSGSAIVNENLFGAYATGSAAANVYAGGNGTATRFITAKPFIVGSEVVKVAGVTSAVTTDYTYDATYSYDGYTWASGLIFNAAPANGASITASYTPLKGFQPCLGMNTRVWNWNASIECNAAGTLGINGGLWAPGDTTVLATLTLTSVGTYNVTDSSKAFTNNQWRGYSFLIKGDATTPTSVGQVRCISWNNATDLYTAAAWTVQPSVGATVQVVDARTQDGTHPTTISAMLMGQACNLSDIV